MGHWEEKQLAKSHLAGQWQKGDRAPLALSALSTLSSQTLFSFFIAKLENFFVLNKHSFGGLPVICHTSKPISRSHTLIRNTETAGPEIRTPSSVPGLAPARRARRVQPPAPSPLVSPGAAAKPHRALQRPWTRGRGIADASSISSRRAAGLGQPPSGTANPSAPTRSSGRTGRGPGWAQGQTQALKQQVIKRPLLMRWAELPWWGCCRHT